MGKCAILCVAACMQLTLAVTAHPRWRGVTVWKDQTGHDNGYTRERMVRIFLGDPKVCMLGKNDLTHRNWQNRIDKTEWQIRIKAKQINGLVIPGVLNTIQQDIGMLQRKSNLHQYSGRPDADRTFMLYPGRESQDRTMYEFCFAHKDEADTFADLMRSDTEDGKLDVKKLCSTVTRPGSSSIERLNNVTTVRQKNAPAGE